MNASRSWILALAASLLFVPGIARAQRSTPVTIVNDFLVEISAVPDSVDSLVVDFAAIDVGGTPPIAYQWHFGDGGSVSSTIFTWSYASPGVYHVVLVATDADGRVASATRDIAVEADRFPAIEILPSARTGIEPLSVRFDSVVTGGNEPLTYSWTVDGVPSGAASTALLDLPGGSHTIGLEVTDVDGDVASDSEVVEVENELPLTAAPVSSETSGVAPLSVSFGVNLVDAGNAPLGYYWEFGEGTTSSLSSPSFMFVDPGLYIVSVRVTDANGDASEGNLVINVLP